jgi:hypothetical protein
VAVSLEPDVPPAAPEPEEPPDFVELEPEEPLEPLPCDEDPVPAVELFAFLCFFLEEVVVAFFGSALAEPEVAAPWSEPPDEPVPPDADDEPLLLCLPVDDVPGAFFSSLDELPDVDP